MFFFETIEILRRIVWAIFRIEWEVPHPRSDPPTPPLKAPHLELRAGYEHSLSAPPTPLVSIAGGCQGASVRREAAQLPRGPDKRVGRLRGDATFKGR